MEPTIDMEVVEELLSLCEEGDMSLLTELIDMFLADGPVKVESVVAGAREGNLERVEQAAHALKGSSGNLGATALMNTAEALQVASRTGQNDLVSELAPKLEKAFADTNDALRALQASYAS